MAASVIGKRTRQVLDEDEISIGAPPKRRSTRRSTPKIYEDAIEQLRPRSRRTKASPVEVLGSSITSCTIPESSNIFSNTIKDIDGAISRKILDDTSTKENLPPAIYSTPTTNRFKDVLGGNAPCTPKQRVRLASKILTPRTPRIFQSPKSQSVYAGARQLFTQASNPTKLVGRESERETLKKFISGAIATRKGGCTYVSGPPGTGKSALVQDLLQDYQSMENVQVAIVNCVAYRTSSEVLGKLSSDFNIATSSSNRKASKDGLAKLFTGTKSVRTSHLVLLDEIDSLLEGDCDVLYSVFEWALHRSSSLILVGIANALDLTDRFLPRLKMRGLKPELLPFLPYSASQISTIITDKLRSLLPADTTSAPDFIPFMHPAAVQLSGKKIASQTGDLRKAFNLVRRAIDQIEKETLVKLVNDQSTSSPIKQPLTEIPNMTIDLPISPPNSSPLKPQTPESRQDSPLSKLTPENAPRATIAHIARIAASIFNNSALTRVNGLNLQQKAVLCSLVASEKRQYNRDPYTTPSKRVSQTPTVKDLFEKYSILCRRDEVLLQPLKATEFRDVVSSLETLGLVYESNGRQSSFLTPTKTPSRALRNPDDKQLGSAVSEKEVRECLNGPGADLLQRLLDE